MLSKRSDYNIGDIIHDNLDDEFGVIINPLCDSSIKCNCDSIIWLDNQYIVYIGKCPKDGFFTNRAKLISSIFKNEI